MFHYLVEPTESTLSDRAYTTHNARLITMGDECGHFDQLYINFKKFKQ